MPVFMKPGSPFLFDQETGDIVGVKDSDGGEQFFPTSAEVAAQAAAIAAVNESVATITMTSAAWSTVWDTARYTDYGDVAVTGPLAITSDDTNSSLGGCSQAVLIANGVNIPTFDGATISDYQNSNGARNLVQLYRAGNSKFWSVGSRLGAALTTPAAPAIGAAPVIATAVAGSPLTFSAASGVTGSPAPTIVYDAIVGGSVVAAGITSGSYTPPTAGVSITVRATATNAQGSATATSDAVTVAAPAAHIRLASLTNMAESGTGPYTYTSTAAGGVGGAPNLSLAASADGSITGRIAAATTSYVGLGFGLTATAGDYTTFLYLAVGSFTSNKYTFGVNGGVATDGNGPDASTAPAVGDFIRLTRSGASILFQVARQATPATWLTIHTIASGASTARLYPRVNNAASGNAVELVSHVGLT